VPSPPAADAAAVRRAPDDRYKWTALFNCTLGTLMATLDASIVLIAMPDIFRGIHLDPLDAANSSYLLWMILGFLIVTSVLVVNFGRLGDLYGRVRLYNLGFVVYTAFSLFLAITWMSGTAAALWLVVMRIFQGVGAALLVAQSPAILTDAFPEHQRGLALGIQNIAGIAGVFIGLVLGGLLAPVDWRLVFFISVPFGILGTAWAYWKLEERGVRRRAPVDWAGNLTFAAGLVLLMIGITYGIEPAGHSQTGWTSVAVLTELACGVAFLAAFLVIENFVAQPMFRLALFKIRAFSAGTLSTLLAGVARGGLMFILIIWLQGIWLPEHGYSFSATPLWAGIYMLPLTGGFLLSGPLSGALSDRFGSRPFATGGMLLSALTYGLLMLLPVDFSYSAFAALLFLNGIAMGTFASPNRAGVMNSLPPQHRGAGGGMNSTFQNAAQVLSIGIFFTLLIVGLAASLPASLSHGLVSAGVPQAKAERLAHLPPVSVLFAAFLGVNPVTHILGAGTIAHLHNAAVLRSRAFFPRLIAAPFKSGLREAFTFSGIACLVAAWASWLRGGRYVFTEERVPAHGREQSQLAREQAATPAEVGA
jgi:MFS family permease